MVQFNLSRGDVFEEAFYFGLLRNITFSEAARKFKLNVRVFQGVAFDRGWINYPIRGRSYLSILEILRREHCFKWCIKRGYNLARGNKHFGFDKGTLEGFARARGLQTRTTPSKNPEIMSGIVERYLSNSSRGEVEGLLRSAGFKFQQLTKSNSK